MFGIYSVNILTSAYSPYSLLNCYDCKQPIYVTNLYQPIYVSISSY